MHKRGTTVTLYQNGNAELGSEFAIEHAEALLAYEEKRGFKNWQLGENPEYILQDGKLIRNPNKGTVSSTGKQRSNRKSESTT